MAITMAQVLTEVNRRTNRAESDISLPMKSVLLDISIAGPFLTRETILTPSAASLSTAVPSTWMQVVTIVSAVGQLARTSVQAVRLRQSQGLPAGTPEYYAVWADKLYWDRAAGNNVPLSVMYAVKADNPQDNPFPDEFSECIIEGVCAKVYEGLGLLGVHPSAQTHLELYGQQLTRLAEAYKRRLEI